MYTSDLAEILPKLGGRARDERNVPFKRSLLRRISSQQKRNVRRSNIGGHPRRGSKAAHAKAPRGFSQRCIVKARIVKMKDGRKKEKDRVKKAVDLHLKYIQRDGVEKDGSKGELYGPDKKIDAAKFGRQIKGEPHQFRFIVSPENAADLDLTEFTKKLMEQMEKDLARKLEWAAVNHYNTDNPHIHIVVRGLDSNGREVIMDRDYISHGIRNRAIEIATMELGLRTESELEMQLKKEITAERYTGLDYKIEQIAGISPDHHTVDLGEYPENQFERNNQLRLTSRLETLESLGLAEHTAYRTWELSRGWQDTLRELGKRNDIINTMHRKINGDPSKYRIINDRTESMKIEGRLSSKGLSNELYDKYYLIVEGTDGASYYVNAHRGMKVDELREGSIVSLSVEKDKWLKSSDYRIDKFARNHQGIYSPKLHLSEIGQDTIEVTGRDEKTGKPRRVKIAPKDFVKSHGRRLYKLRTYGLAEKLDDDRWRIDKNLIDELKKRDLERPLKRVGVREISSINIEDQAIYRGRAWIDRYAQDPDAIGLSYTGFGSEVRLQAKIRQRFFQELGIQKAGEALKSKLDQIEYDDTVNRLKGQKRMVFKRMHALIRFRGEMSCKPLKSGKSYAIVTDSRSKEFTMVPWKKRYENVVGSEIDMQMDSSGNITMKKVNRTIGR